MVLRVVLSDECSGVEVMGVVVLSDGCSGVEEMGVVVLRDGWSGVEVIRPKVSSNFKF